MPAPEVPRMAPRGLVVLYPVGEGLPHGGHTTGLGRPVA